MVSDVVCSVRSCNSGVLKEGYCVSNVFHTTVQNDLFNVNDCHGMGAKVAVGELSCYVESCSW